MITSFFKKKPAEEVAADAEAAASAAASEGSAKRAKVADGSAAAPSKGLTPANTNNGKGVCVHDGRPLPAFAPKNPDVHASLLPPLRSTPPRRH